MNAPRRQRGVALLIALLVVAIAATTMAYLAWDQTLAIRRSEDRIGLDRAWAVALGAEAWAAQALVDNARQHGGEVDLTQPWSQPQRPQIFAGVEVSGQIEDLQGLFNLNTLVAGAQPVAIAVTRYRALLTAQQLPPGLVAPVIDWIDPDSMASGSAGAEDETYLGLAPPYRAANQPFVSASSLRLVSGYTAAVDARIAPWVTALPGATAINVNTAPPPVLIALGLSPAQAQAVVALRAKQPFTTLQQFLASPPLQGSAVDPALLGVGSRYFRVRIEVRMGRLRATLASVLEVGNGGKVRVLLRTRNTTP